MDVGKLFIIIGLVMILIGLGWSLGLGRLPGDIAIERNNTTIYIPIITSILLSIILTILFTLFLRGR